MFCWRRRWHHERDCPPLGRVYTDLNNLDNAQIKADFHNLYQAMNGKDLREMDQILDPVCALCRSHQQSGFQEGVKVGIRLAEELK